MMSLGMLPSKRTLSSLSCFWPAIAGLTAALVVIFGYSVFLRSDCLGRLPASTEIGFASTFIPLTIQNVNEWVHEDHPLGSGFIFHIFAKGFGYPGDVRRAREVAYIPVSMLIFYGTTLVSGSLPSVFMIHVVNLSCHFVAALFMSWALFISLFRVIRTAAFLFVLAGALLFVLLPGPMYYFLFSFFEDMLVLPFFAAFVFLEVMQDGVMGPRLRTTLRIAQQVVLFLGVIVEWCMILVAATLLLKRLFQGQLGSTWRARLRASVSVLVPVGLALCVYLGYFILNRGIVDVLGKFLVHTGLLGPVTAYGPAFWGKHVPDALGPHAAIVLVGALATTIGGCLVFSCWRRLNASQWEAERSIIGLMTLWTLPCFLHSGMFRDHYIENSYTALKFALPLSAFFCLFPVLLVVLIRRAFMPGRVDGSDSTDNAGVGKDGSFWRNTSFIPVLVALAWCYASNSHSPLCPLQSTDEYEKVGRSIAAAAIQADVVFCSKVPPPIQCMIAYSAFAGRCVWSLDRMDDVVKALLTASRDDAAKAPPEPPSAFEWAFFPAPDPPVPSDFTVGVLLEPGKSLPHPFSGLANTAQGDLSHGRFQSLVFSSETLRPLYGLAPSNKPM